MKDRLDSLVLFLLSLFLRLVLWVFSSVVFPLFYAVPFIEKFNIAGASNYPNKLVEEVVNAADVTDICHAHGYEVQEHVVKTQDNYLLTIHRILNPEFRSSTIDKEKVVYFHHGLLTNSELFLLGETTGKCLPFLLADRGYDVWLGNNRGNKYSRKHINLSSKDVKFWDFSLDEYAIFDIPDTLKYILDTTLAGQLTYIGFSQGSSQALAAFSINPQLRHRVRLFVGLSPPLIPRSLSHPVARFLVRSSAELLYCIFGRRAILPFVVICQKLLGPINYMRVVDRSLIYLFNWKSKRINETQKQVGYTHMFSPSSVKSVVHWFQIINNKRFQMYQEEISRLYASLPSLHGKLHRCAPFPVQVIEKMPMMLMYGTDDILIDMDLTQQKLKGNMGDVTLHPLAGYEHMDPLWADDVVDQVFTPIIERIEELHAFTNSTGKSSPDSKSLSEAATVFPETNATSMYMSCMGKNLDVPTSKLSL
ncbi:LAMI_0D10110g1_1 [Lachancea mirantina]|uniref:LAMI_0D10110g1_1 n=1 Tax=Lachancea mirantina TaxID=1230905 RepID=A0A1G4JEA5_9SACH|nr:LAMI_0D10110g1_1 [Lachancea mirantina]